MRPDAIGMFWQDYVSRGRDRVPPPVPDTGWVRPSSFPRLTDERLLGLDIETRDPNLTTLGPGYIRPGDGEPFDGHIAGVAVSTPARAWYFPLRHPCGNNVDERALLQWLRDTFTRRDTVVVGANIAYDVSWLRAYDVHIGGQLLDVQYAEALLDENAYTYALDAIAQRHTGRGKLVTALVEWCSLAFGGAATIDAQAANIHRAPAALVGPYAEEDARLPLDIIRRQLRQLKSEQLYDLFRLESNLLPLLIDMRFHGVRVDLDRAEYVRRALRVAATNAQKNLDHIAGFPVGVNRSLDVAQAFEEHDLWYPTLPSGKPSFRAGWLKSIGHPLAQAVVETRKMQKAAGTFVDSYIYKFHVGGRLFPAFHPLRTDRNGTVSGRLASSHPNGQNFPARDDVIGPLVRSIIVPDEGCVAWRRLDYNQIEYRLLAHYARGPGADEVRERYNSDPRTDYHDLVTELIAELAGLRLDRKLTKNVNFGLVYGMAEPTLRDYINVAEEVAQSIFDAYHKAAPFVTKTYQHFSHLAMSAGEVRTILGRKRRFVYYEPATSGIQGDPVRGRVRAQERYGPVRLAGTHKALNAVLQGSAADIIKQAMVDAYNAGVFDATGLPHLTVHDELGLSDDGTKRAAEGFRELTHIMETCVPLRIPVLVTGSSGPNWGACK